MKIFQGDDLFSISKLFLESILNLKFFNRFDFQGLIVGEKFATAEIYLKQSGILAGVPFVNAILKSVDLQPPVWMKSEGEFIEASTLNRQTIAKIKGPARLILLCERTILNVLARCSGVATKSRSLRSKLDRLNWSGQLVGTRKTTPGFRMVEKYGLLVGQIGTHRYDLSSMIMLKDNHVELSNNQLSKNIRDLKRLAGFSFRIEVECSKFETAKLAAESGADIIMLDNMNPNESVSIIRALKKEFPMILFEASGGITEENIDQYARPEFDIISTSCLVQGYPSIDYSMKIN